VVEILHVTATGWRGAADAAARMKPEDRERWRELGTLKVLWGLVATAETRTDPVTWRAEGGPEAKDFLDALETGRQHPLLTKWEELKATVGRPAPSLLDRSVRYTVVLMVEALHRAGLGKGAARKRAAEALRDVFPEATFEAIRHWQTTFPPVPDDEPRIAGALKRHGHDHKQIIGSFVGLIRFAVDPVVARTTRRILIER
jgi:nucleotide-binding universal stress UspA family protein